MVDFNLIKTAFDGLIGWRQNPDSTGWQLTDLTTSTSGLWFNDVHPALSFENIFSHAPEFDLIEANDAARDAAFTNWLKEKTEAGIVQAVTMWYDSKFENKTAKNLLARNRLFESTGNLLNDLQDTSTDVVGFEVTPVREDTLKTVIRSIGLQFDTNQLISVYLFKSGESDPIQTEIVDYQGSGNVQWETVDWELMEGGSFWVAYDEKAVTGNAVNGIRDFNFNSAGYTTFPFSRFASVRAFSADVPSIAGLWDLSKNVYTLDTNYGLNMKMEVKCDYTSFIIEQKDLFKLAIWYQVGILMLQELTNNAAARKNINEATINKDRVRFDIYGDTQSFENSDRSLIGERNKAINSIQFDQTSIDPICLPCRKENALFKTIGPSLSVYRYL